MNIIYIITVLAIYVLFMLIRKTEKKQSLIGWLAITAIIIICYNVLIGVLLTFLNLLCTLLNLSICNFVVITALVIALVKSKKIQKYELGISDIIFSVALLILIAVISYIEYGFPFKIKYDITDGSAHYYYAEQFCETSTLLYKGENNEIFDLYNSDFRLPGAYINEGILFKVFDNIVSRIDLFVLFDLFVLYLSGILFFVLLKTHIIKENKKLQVVAAVLTIVYVLSYQINSMIYGFVYLSLALDIIIAFLLIKANYEKQTISRKIALPILSFLSFGVFFSYAYFIPVLYIAIIVEIAAKYIIDEENALSENNILTIIWTIVNPLILGVTYFIILPSRMGIENELSTITLDGEIYKNTITNLLVFIPILIVGIITYINNRRKGIRRPREYSTVLFIVSILFLLILFTGNKLNAVSDYYCYKAYYMIWPLVIYVAYKVICSIIEKEKKKFQICTYVYISIYIVAILVSTVMLKSIGINNIFVHNAEIITDGKSLIKRGQLTIIEYINNNLGSEQTYVVSSRYEGRMKWMGILLDKHKIYEDIIDGEEITIFRWQDEKEEKYYEDYYEEYDKMKERLYLDENSDSYSIIYKDEYGFILERK